MPELPEVETLVRRLREPVIGRTIEDVSVYWKRTINRPAPKEFARLLRGTTVQAIERRAKYLVFTLTPRAASQPFYLLVHLKMSGKLSVEDIRAEAKSAVDQLRALQREGGEESGFATDAYLAILDHFLKETAPSGSATNAPAVLPKANPEADEEEK